MLEQKDPEDMSEKELLIEILDIVQINRKGIDGLEERLSEMYKVVGAKIEE